MAARGAPGRAGVFLDFDGTLSPMVAEPAAARPHPGAVELLARLAARWGLVAVVSGRPAGYLAEHLASAGDTRLLGLYGMEEAEPGRGGAVRTHPDAGPWRAAVARATVLVEQEALEGMTVEHKGLTVTLHYRAAPGRAPEVERLASEVATVTGLVAHRGKMSVELRPPIDVDKGTVVASLSEGLDAVAFAGDDLGDLSAFAALRVLEAAGRTVLGVAAAGPETPPEVTSAADVVVDGPDGVVALLARLAED